MSDVEKEWAIQCRYLRGIVRNTKANGEVFGVVNVDALNALLERFASSRQEVERLTRDMEAWKLAVKLEADQVDALQQQVAQAFRVINQLPGAYHPELGQCVNRVAALLALGPALPPADTLSSSLPDQD